MMDDHPTPRPPSALREARDDILERFEAAWEDGKRPAVEDFLPAEAELRRGVPPGKGGMGAVHLAYDPVVQRYVALKTPNERTGPAAERFRREAEAAANLPPHPNLCLVYEAGDVDGVPYLTMVYVRGARTLTAAF